jgi:hypothetical protein
MHKRVPSIRKLNVSWEGQVQWEEDDVMLFLWGNSNTAIEHYQKKVEDSTQQIEQWREGVSCFSLTHIKDCLSHQNSMVTGTYMHAALIQFQGVQ